MKMVINLDRCPSSALPLQVVCGLFNRPATDKELEILPYLYAVEKVCFIIRCASPKLQLLYVPFTNQHLVEERGQFNFLCY